MGGREQVAPGDILRALADIGFGTDQEKTADRIRALELCGKILGLFGRDSEDEAPPAPEMALTMEEKRALVMEAFAEMGYGIGEAPAQRGHTRSGNVPIEPLMKRRGVSSPQILGNAPSEPLKEGAGNEDGD